MHPPGGGNRNLKKFSTLSMCCRKQQGHISEISFEPNAHPGVGTKKCPVLSPKWLFISKSLKKIIDLIILGNEIFAFSILLKSGWDVKGILSDTAGPICPT